MIFAAPDFTERQVNAACYKDLKIILWLVTLYGDSVLTITEIMNKKNSDNGTKYLQEIKAHRRGWFNDPLWEQIKRISEG